VLGPVRGEAEVLARDWLARAGKRWRPFLAVCAYRALREEPDGALPASLRNAAVAVECFHKASLIHDDIEDGDAERYGERTLHEEHGIPIALNVGDLLIGEGYRLLAEADAPAAQRAEMIAVAAEAHRELARGQGAELAWRRRGGPLRPEDVLEIHAAKTAPAFDVALRLGGILAGAGEDVFDVFRAYSRALGIAYQVRDDIEDTGDAGASGGAALSIVTALAQAGGDPAGALQEARRLLEHHQHKAVSSLQLLQNANIKGLLRRCVAKIFHELDAEEPFTGTVPFTAAVKGLSPLRARTP
jgi:geranylgeranyl pyrophosphate synthase